MKKYLILVVALFFVGMTAQAQVVTTTSGGQVLTTSGKPVTFGPASRVSLIATSTMMPNTLHTTVAFACMTRKAHYKRSSSTRFQFVYPNWYVNPNQSNNLGFELGAGNSIAVQGWIEYPVSTYTQITFSGGNTATIPTATTATSDFMTVSVPKGALFYTWTHEVGSGGNNIVSFTNTGSVNSPMNTGTPLSEAGICSNSGVPASPGAITDNLTGKRGYWPIAILGDTTQPTAVLMGDSRTAGVFDIEDTTLNVGNLARSIGPTTAYTSLSLPSDRMYGYWSSHTLRDALIALANPSFIINENGTNEFVQQSGITNAQWEALSKNLMSHMVNAFPTVPIFRTTYEPWTSSTDNWSTVANQTGLSYNAKQTTENNNVRSGAIDAVPYVELADGVTSAHNSGLWKAQDYTPKYYTPDGGHESYLGNLLIAQSGAINPRTLAATAPISYTYPSYDLTGASPSYTTGQFSQAVSMNGSQTLNVLGVTPGLPLETMEGWVNIAANPPVQKAVLNDAAAITISTTGILGIATGDGGQHPSATTITTNAWHHVAMTVSPGIASNSTMTLYLDGVNILQFTLSISSTQWADYAGLSVGANLTGLIDETAMWNFVKYTTNFTPPVAPYVGNEAGLIGLWHFDNTLVGIRGPRGT